MVRTYTFLVLWELKCKYSTTRFFFCRWFIPVNIVLGSISGSLIGLAVATVARPPHPFFKFTIVQIGIGEKLHSFDVHSCLYCIIWNLFTALFQIFFSCFFKNLVTYVKLMINTGNIGNIPLVLIAALCRDKSNPFGDSNKCSQDGTAYISFGQWVGVHTSHL